MKTIKERVTDALRKHPHLLDHPQINVQLSKLKELKGLTARQIHSARRTEKSTITSHRCRSRNPSRYLYNQAKHRSRKRNIFFDITPEDIVVPDYCPVLDIPLVMGRGLKGGPTHNSPSIDRIDPKKGYTPDNIRVISWRANSLKSDASLKELQVLVEDLSRLSKDEKGPKPRKGRR